MSLRVLLCSVWLCGWTAASPPVDDRPLNVLFIAVDDMRPELGCYGHPTVKSPNIDRLAADGILFNRAYCQQAVCNPSRASLLTGLRPETLGVYGLSRNFRDAKPDAITIGQHFKKHGYHSERVGKVFHTAHGNRDDERSWTVMKSYPTAPRYGPRGQSQRLRARLFMGVAAGIVAVTLCGLTLFLVRASLARFSPEIRRKHSRRIAVLGTVLLVTAALGFWRCGLLTSTLQLVRKYTPSSPWEAPEVPDHALTDGSTAENAIGILNNVKDRPFFLAVGFRNPHLPLVAPKAYWDLYDPGEIPLAGNPYPPKGSPSYAATSWGELRAYDGMPKEGALTEEQARTLIHAYWASVSYVDALVGKLLAELDRLQLRDRTLVVLWGDHGFRLGEHGFWCKHTNYETSARAPLIVSVPGQKKRGIRTDALVEFVDVFPSLAEACGLPLPVGLDGLSFLPLLDDPTRAWKKAAFHLYPRSFRGRSVMGRAIRTDRFRLVEWRLKGGEPQYELFDHSSDPHENLNLADDPQYQSTVTTLTAQLHAGWKKALPDGVTAAEG